LIIGVDYGGNQWTGNAIQFIQEKYNLGFIEAMEKIAQDFNLLKKSKNKQYKAVVQKDVSHTIIKKPLLMEADEMPFSDKHKRYMDKIGLDEEYCLVNDVAAVKKWAINKKIQKFKDDEYSFVYRHRTINGNETGRLKILRLGNSISKEEKWKTNVPNSDLWRLHTVDKACKYLFIVKSLKDAMVLNRHYGLCTIAVQNESAQILLENNYDVIQRFGKENVICFGTDFQGWHQSLLITEVTGWKYFNTPNNVYDSFGVEDPSDYISNFSINSLSVLLRNKGFIN
jgi:hypothetical protein